MIFFQDLPRHCTSLALPWPIHRTALPWPIHRGDTGPILGKVLNYFVLTVGVYDEVKDFIAGTPPKRRGVGKF